MTADEQSFEADAAPAEAAGETTLIVDVEGFEGPLDLLLTLARQQKVDLTRISIVALADQYLAFVEEARKFQLELAADYLVMAAWLAYLKSRLLLPTQNETGEGPSAADMATALALRLRRLEAIRAAAAAMTERPQLGRDFFARGEPQPMKAVKRPEWSATLYDLLSAYAVQRRRNALAHVRFAPRAVWSLKEAREALERVIGKVDDWGRLDDFLLTYAVEPSMRATVFASTFAATLELVREGQIEVHQASSFAPIFLRKRETAPPAA
ncbi:MAG: segregation/condensation protein A, partial [Rhizobiales bacterium]|nr:segregation/condensation protein A [Hyphomicrobiales bacterium]